MGINKDKNMSEDSSGLRRQAEERLRDKKHESHPHQTMDEMQRLIHELEVHQIELGMQNTELRLARDETEKALEMYTDLYDFAPVGYITIDPEGAVRAANLTAARLLEIERSRLIGHQFTQFIANDARPLFTTFLRKIFESRSKGACEVALLKEGAHSSIVQIEALTAATGQECRMAVIDITERRQLEKNLEMLHTDLAARAAELEAANIELEAFNYTVSHDLRSPLTVINSYIQVLQVRCGSKLDDECKGYIREMYEGTNRMSRLIDTLIGFSHFARIKMRREKVDLSAMAKAVAAELIMEAPESTVSFRITDEIIVDGDPGLLQVVLDNLIGNAWKFTNNRDGVVIEFGVKLIDGTSTCFIRDNGPGFAMTHAEKLFAPFQRLPGAAEFKGHGIGLATVERIIKRHGGKVWAEGETGKGACFYFTLSAN